MIKSSELRLRNMITDISTNDTFIVTGINDNNLNGYFINSGGVYDNINILKFKPIPLSEEILLKVGFEKDSLGAFVMKDLKFIVRPVQYGKPHLLKGIDDKGYSFELSTDESWESIIRVKYIHQLQNLYFALTGQELNTSGL